MPVVDRHGANARAEKAFQNLRPDRLMVQLTCDLHKAANAMKHSLKLVDSTVSGVVHTGLATESCGSLAGLRDALISIFKTDLCIIYDNPPRGHVENYHKEMLNLFCPVFGSGSIAIKNAKRQYVLRRMCNSDLQSDSIIHFCRYGCCESPESTQEIFMTLVTSSLLPSKCGVLSRKSWTNAEKAFSWTGMLSCHWNLLDKILSKFSGKPTANPNTPQPPCTAEEVEVENQDDDGWNQVGHVILSGGVTASRGCELLLPQLASEKDGNAVTSGDSSMPHDTTTRGDVDWAAINRLNANSAVKFSRTEFLRNTLAIIRQAMDPGMRLIHTQLQLSGESWENMQLFQAAQGHQRSYQILESPKAVEQCFIRIAERLFATPVSLPLKAYTCSVRALLFRLLSALACALEFTLRRYQRIFPHRLFELLNPQEYDSGPVFRIPNCLRDDLAKHFFDKYPSCEKASSVEAQSLLQAVAHLVELDIADVEAKHSTIRELTLLRTRGSTISLNEVSARDLFHFVGSKYDSVLEKKKQQQEKQKQQQQDEQQEESEMQQQQHGQRKKYKASVGGPWKAFLRHHSKGKFLTPEMIRNLSIQYHALSYDEFQFFVEQGLAAVAAQTLAETSCERVPESSAVVPASDSVIAALDSNQWTMAGYQDFCRMVLDTAAETRKLKRLQAKQEAEALAVAVQEPDPQLANTVSHVGSAFGQNLINKPCSQNVAHHNWIPPVETLVEARGVL